jgi:hypothetical protein
MNNYGAPIAAYIQGNTVRITATFTDLYTDEADPTDVEFTTHAPDGTEVTYVYGIDPEITKDSTGVYYCDFVINQGGTWTYRWTGVGVLVAAGQGSLESIPANP